MATTRTQIFLFASLLVLALRSQCQPLENDQKLTNWYDTLMGADHIGLIEGKYYPVHFSKGESHQFYGDKSWTSGQVKIKGQTYNDIMLMYELVDDVLLLKHPVNYTYHAQPIELLKAKVEQFYLHDSHFINIQKNDQGLKHGYYHLLLDGEKIQLLVKRSKFVRTEVNIEYTPQDWAYIVTDTNHFRVKNRWSLYRNWPKEKTELRKFIRQNGFKTNLKYESQMIKVVTYLDELLTDSTLKE
jgi:hypothetical protein